LVVSVGNVAPAVLPPVNSELRCVTGGKTAGAYQSHSSTAGFWRACRRGLQPTVGPERAAASSSTLSSNPRLKLLILHGCGARTRACRVHTRVDAWRGGHKCRHECRHGTHECVRHRSVTDTGDGPTRPGDAETCATRLLRGRESHAHGAK